MGRIWISSLLFLLGACSSLSGMIPFMGPPKTRIDEVRITADAGANGNHPTRLDLVFIYDKSVQAALPKSGPEWFKQKAALLSAYPKKLDVASFELPPLSVVSPAGLPENFGKALVVLAYADYRSPGGQGVADMTTLKCPLIRLGAGSFAVEEQH